MKSAGAMILLLKEMCHLYAESLADAARRNIFIDVVFSHMQKFTTTNKPKSERRKSSIHSYYAVMEPIIIWRDYLAQQQTKLLAVSYDAFFKKYSLHVLCKRRWLHFSKGHWCHVVQFGFLSIFFCQYSVACRFTQIVVGYTH